MSRRDNVDRSWVDEDFVFRSNYIHVDTTRSNMFGRGNTLATPTMSYKKDRRKERTWESSLLYRNESLAKELGSNVFSPVISLLRNLTIQEWTYLFRFIRVFVTSGLGKLKEINRNLRKSVLDLNTQLLGISRDKRKTVCEKGVQTIGMHDPSLLPLDYIHNKCVILSDTELTHEAPRSPHSILSQLMLNSTEKQTKKKEAKKGDERIREAGKYSTISLSQNPIPFNMY